MPLRTPLTELCPVKSKPTPQSNNFISEAHKSKEAPTWTPGPGAYSLPPSLANYADVKPSKKKANLNTYMRAIGKQQSSTIESVEAWRFGTQERFDSVKDRKAAAIPGPGAYFT